MNRTSVLYDIDEYYLHKYLPITSNEAPKRPRGPNIGK